ncbi:DNA primase [Candidatus Parcubacteria bacterium]|nr:DNA primase [Candidatus Parcubacteria bacterium]
MFNSPIDEIKNRLDIVEVIGGYIKLQKTGINYRAICPFHSEKRPSFFVSPSRQMWHCFGSCSEGGDVFKFIMKIEGVEFPEALKILAQRAGVELKKISPKIRTERQRLYEISDLAANFFSKQLESKTGQQAKKYLLERGISEDSIKKWRIGYAPDVWEGLSDFLVSQGYKREEIIKAGLAIKKEEGGGGEYDRFRKRIMFPIFDLNSQVVGFTGRIFGDSKEVAKYVNTPNTPLYDKSRILYGLNKAKMAIRQEDECILVEGQTDVILSHQSCVENVVATSGTALTPFQLAILKRYSENLVTAFDMDIAGDSATKKGIDLAQVQGFNIKVAIMPEGKDPADIASENPEQWKEIIDKTKSIMDFYFETTFSKFDSKTAEGKKVISKILLPKIKKIPNKIEQAHWIQQLSQKIEIKEVDIEVELKKANIEKLDYFSEEAKEAEKSELAPKSKKELLEERILSLVLKSPENLSFVSEDYFPLFSSQTKEILINLKKEQDFFKKEDTSPELKNFLNELCFKREIEESEVEPKEEIETCLKEIQLLASKNKLDELSQAIKKAEETKDLEKISSLTVEFNKLCQRLNEN